MSGSDLHKNQRHCQGPAREKRYAGIIRSILTRLEELTSTPAAFAVLVVYFSLWLIADRASLDWHAVATCATLAMTLFIQMEPGCQRFLNAILRWRLGVVRGVRVVLGNSRDQRATDERLQVRFDRIRQRLSVHFITVDVEREGFEIFRLLFGILDRRLCPRDLRGGP